jgi:hypothetical protein
MPGRVVLGNAYFTLSDAYALGSIGAKGRFLARGEISTSHLATRLDGYSLEEPMPPAPAA